MGNFYNPNPIATTPFWTWNTTNPNDPVPTAFYNGNLTKTGLMPNDLISFVGVPIQLYGNPIATVPSPQLFNWLRWAEDYVEQETNLLLCPTWVASPPAFNTAQANSLGVLPKNGAGQQLGVDYDLYDAPYDFQYSLAQDSAWMVRPMRYRPLRNLNPSSDTTALKLMTLIYPLLSEYMRIPPSWYVEDQDFGMIRIVPAEDVALLPLWAIELTFMGFSDNLPGGIWTQYTAGLTNYDYATRFSFVKQLVLSVAAIQALQTVQGTINVGADQYQVEVDGMAQNIKYNPKGPYNGLIQSWMAMRDDLMKKAISKISGPAFFTL